MMRTELEPVKRRHFRRSIPKEHRQTLDTRLKWLWNQRFGTVQTIWNESDDILDKTACTTILQAILEKDLNSVKLLLSRLEGGPQMDEEVAERSSVRV